MNAFVLGFAIIGGAGLFLSLFRKPRVRPLDDASRAAVEQLALAGKHVDAIRRYREATNASLKDANVAIEQIERG
jgi:hypothetical protein